MRRYASLGLLTCVLACSASRHLLNSNDAGGDSGLRPEASDAASDAGGGEGDADADGGPDPLTDGGFATYGDRNIGTVVSFPRSAMAENGGCVINLRSPPPGFGIDAAAGDGVTDDTAAFQDAYDYIKSSFLDASVFDTSCTWIYLPNGKYLVSDTLIYRGPSLYNPDAGLQDIVNVRFMGQSREATTIQLRDRAPGFQDPQNPKMVLTLQHPQTSTNNIPASNAVDNLTIDVGSGNPGAIGLSLQGANTTEMTNVEITSDDGMGAYGLYFHVGSLQGAYRDITVHGFDFGVYQDQNIEVDESLEHITLSGQAKVGAAVSGGSMTVRAALIDESASEANAFVLDQSGGQLAIVDSKLVGKAATAIETTDAGTHYLFARNDLVQGFGVGIGSAGSTEVSGNVTEYVSSPPIALSTAQPTRSLALPVLDAPLVPWFDPATQWADVDAFGAKGDGTTDDTAAIQAALDSGEPVVFFPRRSYLVTSVLKVPATVQRLEVFFAKLSEATFSISENSSNPILIRDTRGMGRTESTASRDVVLQLCSGQYSNHAGPLNLFVEGCENIGGDPSFTIAGQHTFARSINNEESGSGMTFDPATQSADIQVAGGSLWVLNYKTENKPIPAFSALPGSFVEVLGGYVNVTADPAMVPMIVNDGANVSYLGTTNLFCNKLTPFIEELRDGSTDIEPASSLPLRNFVGLYGYAHSPCYTVPLYVGYDPKAVPPPP